ncbi:MAG TPA: molybdenum ABC transporter ATP-binding protein [Phenylobacterium sp.]|jgi:molybdate transport system ATP-binding protein
MSGVEGRFAGRLGSFTLDAEFAFPADGITALSGPSGSGKTTILRCMAGLARFEGRLSVDGEVWQDGRSFRPPHRRPVGMVFQEASLLAHLSVRDNLLYGARRAGAGADEGLDDTVELLGLAPLLARSTANLSGGERQRVALGRALLSRPRLLLLDEPLSSLDAGAKAEILPYLERLHRTLAVPALYVSHDAGEIARLADRVLFLEDGRVLPGAPAAPADPLAGLTPRERDALARAALSAGLTPQA